MKMTGSVYLWLLPQPLVQGRLKRSKKQWIRVCWAGFFRCQSRKPLAPRKLAFVPTTSNVWSTLDHFCPQYAEFIRCQQESFMLRIRQRTQGTKCEMLRLTGKMTTRACVYALGAFAIHSLRFFLHFRRRCYLPCGKSAPPALGIGCERVRGTAGAPSLRVFCARVGFHGCVSR